MAAARLAACALVSVGAWLAVEGFVRPAPHPRYPQMVEAARTMRAAMHAIARAKEARGLVQGREVDPNRTGLIGPEFSEITTTMGVLEAKRTATNPDLAAALVRALDGLAAGDPVVLSLSGSFVGANIAALAAARALRLEPLIVTSLGASMYGATDAEFNWLEIEAVLRDRNVLQVKSDLAVLGGYEGSGRGIGEAGLRALGASAARHGVAIVAAEDFRRLIAGVVAALGAQAGGLGRIRLLINAGGSDLALGTCHDADRLPVGLSRRSLSCAGGIPGLVVEFSRRGVPVLHILNMRRLALDWGLPFDPVPLPESGANPRVYGSGKG